MTWWKCSNCGYIFEGDEVPDQCPNCGEKCTFYDVSCYTPECGFCGIDPKIAGRRQEESRL
ncbi:rubredoxin [Methanococcus voltae]|uniref:rubredoxin-like domain-containing protein n=1 Tax=Methanococcus voltae TaxID=2188 RepID=UPI001AE82F08|nr:hypothetical protein [Methanococcus voltae]MBP2144064.1 rubredoxin [Methanococcus voltae]